MYLYFGILKVSSVLQDPSCNSSEGVSDSAWADWPADGAVQRTQDSNRVLQRHRLLQRQVQTVQRSYRYTADHLDKRCLRPDI